MLKILKQSTAATIKLGPFVDDTDGKTAETGLTISQADIRLSKNGGDFAQTNNATGATHDENGYYDVPLDTTDTATLGRLTIAVSESGALAVRDEYMVVAANVYDSLVGASDKLDVNLEEWKGSAAPANTGDAYARLGAPAGASIAADIATVDGVADAIKAKTDNLPASPAATGAAMTLTSDERTTLAAAIEAAIINDLDGEAVMQAIADLIASDMTTTDLTVAAIATACRDAILNRVLNGNHDTAGTPGKLLQNCDAPISDVPTVAEFEARTVPAASIATSTQTAAILDAVGVVDTVVDAIKVKTDQLNFTGTDVKATLDSEEVTPTAASKTGYKLASDGLDGVVIETGLNARQALSVIAASAAGVLDGAATEEITMAAAGVPATNRITATVDENGNRSAVTLSPPT